MDRSIQPAEIRALVGRDDPVILEIGANDGQDSQKFLAEFPGLRLFCFEPDPRPLRRFRRRIADARCELIEAALSDADGEAPWWQSSGWQPNDPAGDGNYDLSSSLLPPARHLEISPWLTFPRKITVRTLRLDTWLAGRPDIERVDFVWADVQGAEAKLIRGGGPQWSRVHYLYTEFADVALYEGQPDRQAILDLLPGFRLREVYDNNLLLENAAHV